MVLEAPFLILLGLLEVHVVVFGIVDPPIVDDEHVVILVTASLSTSGVTGRMPGVSDMSSSKLDFFSSLPRSGDPVDRSERDGIEHLARLVADLDTLTVQLLASLQPLAHNLSGGDDRVLASSGKVNEFAAFEILEEVSTLAEMHEEYGHDPITLFFENSCMNEPA